MKCKPTTVERVVRLLSDPFPAFVSLVSHGANQTPFRVVKNQDGQVVDKSLMTFDGSEHTRPQDHGGIAVQKIEFDKEQFSTEKEASIFLSARGYENFLIEDSGNKYIAKSAINTTFKDNVGKIKTNVTGVDIFVGEIESEDAEQTVEKGHKESTMLVVKGLSQTELVAKYDDWAASWSDSKVMAEVIASGYEDGMPPGAYDINFAYWTAVMNALKENDVNAVRTASTELGEILISLHQVFTNAMSKKSGEDQMIDIMKAFAYPVTKQVEDVAPEVEAPANEPDVQETPVVEAPAEVPAEEVAAVEKTEAPAEEVAAEPATEDAPAVEAPVEPAVEEAVAAPAEEAAVEKSEAPDMLTAMKSYFDEKFNALNDQVNAVKATAEQSSERVAKLEGTSTQRRSTEDDGRVSEAPASVSKEEASKNAFELRMKRDRLGI